MSEMVGTDIFGRAATIFPTATIAQSPEVEAEVTDKVALVATSPRYGTRNGDEVITGVVTSRGWTPPLPANPLWSDLQAHHPGGGTPETAQTVRAAVDKIDPVRVEPLTMKNTLGETPHHLERADPAVFQEQSVARYIPSSYTESEKVRYLMSGVYSALQTRGSDGVDLEELVSTAGSVYGVDESVIRDTITKIENNGLAYHIEEEGVLKSV